MDDLECQHPESDVQIVMDGDDWAEVCAICTHCGSWQAWDAKHWHTPKLLQQLRKAIEAMNNAE